MHPAIKWSVGLILATVITVGFLPQPAQAIGLNFGGKILSSQFRICKIPAPPPIFFIPVPMQVLYLGAPSYKVVEYIWYAPILQLFHVTTTVYNFGNFVLGHPSVIGQYIPVTIPWYDCEFYPTNIITKIGTSLF